MRLLKNYLFCPILTGDMCDLLSKFYMRLLKSYMFIQD